MKKTLMTLAALACGAASALADGTLVWDLTVSGDSFVKTGADGETYEGLTITDGGSTITDGVCTTPGANNRFQIADSSATLAMNDSFSFVIQGGLVSEPANWGVLFGLGQGPNNNLKVNTSEGMIGFAPEGYTLTNEERFGSVTTGMGTYIVTYDVTGDGTASVSLYQNGVLAASCTCTVPSTGELALDTFTIGGRPYSASNLTEFSFTNAQLYEGVLSSEQIADLSGVTPEPTTATLSLLALAGLCARRRRK